MRDALKDLTPVDIDFTPGERPSDLKLEGMMTQVAEGLEFLEGTVGDSFGESLELENVWISNLSRDIGDRSLLNPVLLPDVTLSSYVQDLTLGKLQHELDLVPVGTGAAIISSSADTSVVPGQFQTNVEDLDVPGDWTIGPGLNEGGVVKNSRVLMTHAPSSGGTVTFANMTSGRGSSFVGGRHNTIPSIAQARLGGSFLSVTLSDVINNIYTIVLPAWDSAEDRLYEDSNATISNTKSSVGGGQQMKLPTYMFDVAGLDMGTTDGGSGQGKFFPLNMIRIYDYTAGKLVDGLLEVQASNNVGNREFEITCKFRSDIILDTVTGEYVLVTSGTTASDLLGAVAREVFFHTHEGDDMIRSIKHSSLLGLRTGTTTVSNRSDYYGPSSIDGNDHSHSLHRDGFTDSDDGAGGNVFRGELVVGSTSTGSEPDHENYNLLADSYTVTFGHLTGGGQVYFDKIRTHTLPEGRGNIPQNFSDNALVVKGSLDDGTSLINTVFVDGTLRTAGDVALGTADTDDVFMSGDLYVHKAVTLTPEADPLASRTPETGMIAYNSNKDAPEYYDGTAIKTLSSNEDQLGDMMWSLLSEAQFQAQRDTTWVLATGQSIAGSDLDTLTGISTLPDTSDQFLRAIGSGGRGMASLEADATAVNGLTAAHTHAIDHDHPSETTSSGGSHTHLQQGVNSTLSGGTHTIQGNTVSGILASSVNTQAAGVHSHSLDLPAFVGTSGPASPALSGDSETRPTNIAANLFVKINK